jgi:hypothetical protein
MPKRGTIRQIADHLNVDPKTVRNAIAAAGLDEKAVTFDQGVEIAKAIADPARINGHQATRVSTNTALTDARIRHEELRARQLEIANARAEGRLIDREAVTATGVHIIATVRTALLSLGYRLAEKVAGKTDVGEIARLIETDVRDVLGALADETQFFAALDADALS